MVALDFSMVALAVSGFPHGGPRFPYGLQVPPWWPWVSLNPPHDGPAALWILSWWPWNPSR